MTPSIWGGRLARPCVSTSSTQISVDEGVSGGVRGSEEGAGERVGGVTVFDKQSVVYFNVLVCLFCIKFSGF